MIPRSRWVFAAFALTVIGGVAVATPPDPAHGRAAMSMVATATAATPAVATTDQGAATPAAADAAPAAADAAPADDDETLTLRVGFAEELDGLNPFSAWSAPTWEALRLTYNFLTWYDDAFEVAPELATSWEHDRAGRVWTFHLRDDVRWHDGVLLTARDVAFTYNLILDNDLGAFTGYLPYVTGVWALDDTTLVIENSRPSSGMLALPIPILPEHVWSAIPRDEIDSWENVPAVGSGPFQVVESTGAESVKLVANKDYFAGPPALDEIWFMGYPDSDECVRRYVAGELDAVSLTSVASLRALQATPGSTADAYQAIGFHQLGFNCWDDPRSKGDPALRDARVRRAVHWAIDKQRLVDVAMGGHASPGTTVLSPLVPWHREPTTGRGVACDPDKAGRLLDDAGYADVDGDGWRETPAGRPWSLRLTALTDYPEDVTAATMIAGWLGAVGIATTLDPMASGAFDEANWEGDFDLFLWSWGGEIDPAFMLSAFTTGQIRGWSDCFYSNQAYDRLYRRQAAAADPGERAAIISEMQRLLYDQAPYVVLWYAVDTCAYRSDRWSGWIQAPTGRGSVIRNFSRSTYLSLRPLAQPSRPHGERSWRPYLVVTAVCGALVVVALVGGRRMRRARRAE